MKSELEALEQLDHPHIVRVLDLCEDKNHIYIVTELLKQGNLLEVMTKMQKQEVTFTERDIAEIIYQILLAINYIHNSNMMHRDMKLENVMIEIKDVGNDEHQMVCKITDFGFACMMDPARRSSLSIGTPIYMAPEVLNKAYDVKADIWSVGVIAYIMLTGKQPFVGKDGDQNDLFTKIRYFSPDYEELEKYNDDGMQVTDFIKKCLNRNPK